MTRAPAPIPARVFALLACVLLALGAFLLQPTLGDEAIGSAALLILLGGLALGVAVWFAPETPHPLTSSPTSQRDFLRSQAGRGGNESVLQETALTPVRMSRLGWLGVGIGLALLYAVTIVSAGHFVEVFPQGMAHHLQFVLICAGIALVVWGLGGGCPHPKSLSLRERDLPPFALREKRAGDEGNAASAVLLLTLITLLALLLRTWHLGNAIRLFVDELNFALGASQFWARGNVELILPRVMSFPGIYSYWQAWAVDIFGRNLTGLRVVSAVIGALTVPALYLLTRRLFDRPTGLIAAVLLATFPPHVHFSRLGINNVVEPLFGVLGFAFLAGGLRRNRRLDYALAGAMFGCTQYFYEGGRVVSPALLVGWLALLLLQGRLRGHGRGLLILVISALIVAAPTYYVLLAKGAPLLTRLDNQGLDVRAWAATLDKPLAQAYVERFGETLALLVHTREATNFYGGGQPFLLAYAAAPFFLGVFHALWRPRLVGAWLGIGGVALVMVGNTLLVDPIDAPRYVTAFPYLCLLAAVGVRYTAMLVFPIAAVEARRRLAPALVTTVIVALIAAGQITYYFNVHIPVYNVQFRKEADSIADGQDAVFRSIHFPPGTQVYIISDPRADQLLLGGMIAFLGQDLTLRTLTPDEISPAFLQKLSRSVDHAFYIEIGDTTTIQQVERFFTLLPPTYSPYDIPPDEMFLLYYARHEQMGSESP